MPETRYELHEDQPTYLLTDPERRDVTAWNNWYSGYQLWRTEQSVNDVSFWSRTVVRIACEDLSGADLAGAYLIGVNIGACNARGAILSGAELTCANLYGSDLTGADLSGADLAFADLRCAVLTGANLDGATWSDMTEWPDGFTPPEARP